MTEGRTNSGRHAMMWRRELWKLQDRIAESHAGEGLQQFLKQQQVKKRITMDQARYITNNYEGKREAIGKMMKSLVENLWKESPLPHLRTEFANILTLTISFSEMWHWISTTMNREYGTSMKSFLPCALIDKFHEFVTVITQCHRYLKTDMGTFATLLRLRDEVVVCLQDYYRIIAPLYEDKPARFVMHEDRHRYRPYDFEWLSGSVNYGPARLSCVRYLCVSRLAHMDLSTLRSDIIAMKYGIDLEYIKNVRVPLPAEATDSGLLIDALNNSERKIRDDYEKGYNIIKKELGDFEELQFMDNIARSLKVTGIIRNKKRAATSVMEKCKPERLPGLYHLIAVMVTLETHILIVHRVAALFTDKKLGIYGTIFPDNILVLLEKIIHITTEESCQTFPLNNECCELLGELREANRAYCKEYYNAHEERCESLRTGDVVMEVPEGDADYSMTFDIETTNFPSDVGSYAGLMMEQLMMQQIEIRRLLWEYHMVRLGVLEWPANNPVELKINTCPKGIVGYYSNVPDFFTQTQIEEANKLAADVWNRATEISSVGYNMIDVTRQLMETNSAVPDFTSLKLHFTKEFEKAIGSRKISDQGAVEIASDFAYIIDRDIALMDYRRKYVTPKIKAAEMAEKIASAVVNQYITHLNRMYEGWNVDREQAGETSESSQDEAPTGESLIVDREEVVRAAQSDSDSDSDDGNNAAAAYNANVFEMIQALCRPVFGGNIDERHMQVTPDEAVQMMAEVLHEMGPARDAIIEAATNPLFRVEDDDIPDFRYELPDDLVDCFLENFLSVNIPPEFDYSASYFNLPVD